MSKLEVVDIRHICLESRDACKKTPRNAEMVHEGENDKRKKKERGQNSYIAPNVPVQQQ